MFLGEVERIAGKYISDVLAKLVEIPTVSAWGGSEMVEGANLVSSLLKSLGFRVEVKSGGGNPVVFGEIGDGSKTVLIYNHYDVQPPDPMELWDSDPFEMVIRDGRIYGRGVADNKGNIAARLAALEILLPHIDELDLKVKFIIEGEEEVGSPTLARVVEDNREWLRASGGIWETGYVKRDGRLSISLGFKGMIYFEASLRGANRDVHSGYSPIIPNPVWRIARMLTLLKDENGNVLVPGFYDGIDREFLETGEIMLREVDIGDLEAMASALGIKEFVGGVRGVEALRRLYLMPSLNVSGLYSGYTGKGSKTIVPSTASIKIDVRLVPGQKPDVIMGSILEYLKSRGFQDIEVKIESMYPSGYTKPGEPIVKASIDAALEAYGVKPEVLPMAAGSGPIYLFTNILGIPMTGAGVGYYDSRVHAPNENIRLEDFIRGVKHIILTLINFAAITR
ncbi:MAG: M20/M25/M40 family metallo-hydrolase [Acidilobaceae archaeon]